MHGRGWHALVRAYLPHRVQDWNEDLGFIGQNVVATIPRNVAITDCVEGSIDGKDDVCDGGVPRHVAVGNGSQAGGERHLAGVVPDAKAINDLFWGELTV